MATVNIDAAVRRAVNAHPEELEQIFHTCLVARGVPVRQVARLSDPLDFEGPADYLKHIKETLSPAYDITWS